jgi:CubicO group peptidase (beta-lactamase class C family)
MAFTWTECEPAAVGMSTDGIEAALDVVRARGARAQLCVLRNGHVVLDRSFGCEPESLFWIFSASKPYTALAVHLLAERGQLSLDDPVTAYWPEFGHGGKEAVTIRQVLQHRSGLACAGSSLGDALAMTHWDRSVRRIERAKPRWPIGAVPAYQYLSYGFMLGELVQRASGSPIAEFLRDEFFTKMGLADTYLGLPDDHWPRHVPLKAMAPVQAMLNRRRTRAAVIPAAGISTNARDLARFYQMLLSGGDVDGIRIFRQETIRQACTPSSDGERDRYLRVTIRWSQGFQLGGPRIGSSLAGPMGRLTSKQTFGHNGSNCCIAWADPQRNLVFAYLTNVITSRWADLEHQASLADATIRACN